MQTLNWLESHIGTIEDAIQELNENFCWFITIVEGQQKWFVKSGEKVIFSTNSREAVDAFLYGMGLAVMGIPEQISDQLRVEIKKWCEDMTG